MKKAYLLGAFLYGLTCMRAAAEQWKADHNYMCPDMSSDMAIRDCSFERFHFWDKRLNQAYQNAISALSSQESQPQRDALKKAQRLWVQYRDANCGYYYLEPGTIHQMDYATCLRKMTQDRALELQQGIFDIGR